MLLPVLLKGLVNDVYCVSRRLTEVFMPTGKKVLPALYEQNVRTPSYYLLRRDSGMCVEAFSLHLESL